MRAIRPGPGLLADDAVGQRIFGARFDLELRVAFDVYKISATPLRSRYPMGSGHNNQTVFDPVVVRVGTDGCKGRCRFIFRFI